MWLPWRSVILLIAIGGDGLTEFTSRLRRNTVAKKAVWRNTPPPDFDLIFNLSTSNELLSNAPYLDVNPNSFISGLNATTIFPTTTSTHPTLNFDEIDVVGLDDRISFYANETIQHFRTDNLDLSFDLCLEFKYRIEGRRTRLLVYTCQMTENGICILNKFVSQPIGTMGNFNEERCHRLRPWNFHTTPFGFHFKFVRRPRRFADKETEERFRRKRRGRRSVREVGRVVLTGLKKCSDACKNGTSERVLNVKKSAAYNPYVNYSSY